jgi:hypothetical protein
MAGTSIMRPPKQQGSDILSQYHSSSRETLAIRPHGLDVRHMHIQYSNGYSRMLKRKPLNGYKKRFGIS